jgi:hypothetical protein
MSGTKQTIQSRYVTLQEWAEQMFSKVPHDEHAAALGP